MAATRTPSHPMSSHNVAGRSTNRPLPKSAGISFKHQHIQSILENKPDIEWFEVHPENYMVEGGPAHFYLEKICEQYALSMHGVGLSLGSADGIQQTHLHKLKTLVDRYQPHCVSEHLSWSHWQTTWLNDLLPLPLTEESLAIVCNNIQRVQDTLQRSILIENPSTYLCFDNNNYSETEFLSLACKKTGCGVLLDINNIVVSCSNHNQNAQHYLDAVVWQDVKEIHLAGHTQHAITPEKKLLIDDHGSCVSDQTWQLYDYALLKLGRRVPTLIEWDTNIPPLNALLAEAEKAQQGLNKICVNKNDPNNRAAQ